MNHFLKKAIACLLSAALLVGTISAVFLNASEGTSPGAVSFEMVGLGGGGYLYTPLIDPTDSSNYVVTCDMGSTYVTRNSGESWNRLNTPRIRDACMAEDGTLFMGSYGIFVSNDKGRSMELIYPRQETVEYSISRLGQNAELLVADGYDNGYVLCLDVWGDYLYFITMDWSQGGRRFGRCFFDGTGLEIFYTDSTGESPSNLTYAMVAGEDCFWYSDGKQVWAFDVNTQENTLVYTPEGELVAFEQIGDEFFILDDLEDGTKVLYTKDFSSYQNLMDYNSLPNQYTRKQTTYYFEWHFNAISGSDFNHIWLGMVDKVSGLGRVGGAMKFDGERFHWVYDTMFMNNGTVSDLGWVYGGIVPISGLCADPSDGNRCLMTNSSTVFELYYDGADNRQVRTLHCSNEGDEYYTTSGIDVQTTYWVREDPFDEEHIIICSTDLGMQISFDGGESFRRMDRDGSRIYNTCYDLYFDENTEGTAYALWSSVHDAPYTPSLSQRNGVEGRFAISEDGGISWDFTYSTGIPESSIPVRMSVVHDGDELTIAVATFNNGFYLSHDSGRTFTCISDDMEDYQGFLWGEDVVIVDDVIYCLTASHTLNGRVPSQLYCYNMTTGETEEIVLDEEIIVVRSLTYDERYGLYLNVSPIARWEYVEEIGRKYWVNHGGGVYRLKDDGVELVFEVSSGVYNSGFNQDGTLYVAGEIGTVYVREEGAFRVYSEGLFPRLKNISFSNDGETLYVTSLGGGTHRIDALALEPQPEDTVTPPKEENGGNTDNGLPEEKPEDNTNRQPEPETYTVAFVDWDGTVLSIQTVNEGENAKCPADPCRSSDREGHYTFMGWDTDTDRVQSNLTVQAQYEITDHNRVIQGAAPATCTSKGYTGDVVCTECGILLEEGSTVSKQPHTEGKPLGNGDGTHTFYCDVCGADLGDEDCSDYAENGCCDLCGDVMEAENTYCFVTSFVDGGQYLILSSGMAFDKDRNAVEINMVKSNSGYTTVETVGADLLWTYRDGALYTVHNGERYYLAVSVQNNWFSGTAALTTTTSSGSASSWTLNDGMISTRSAAGWRSKTYYLYVKSGEVTVSTISQKNITVYRLDD